MPNYFAYGSNNSEQLSRRLGHDVEILGQALLPNYKYAYQGYSQVRGCGTANAVYHQGHNVWGILYANLSEDDLEKLDLYEGAAVKSPSGKKRYFRKTIEVTLVDNGAAYDAEIYFLDQQGVCAEHTGIPSREYVWEVIKTALEAGFPESYITKCILPLSFCNSQKATQ